jgi:hypothetical protein
MLLAKVSDLQGDLGFDTALTDFAVAAADALHAATIFIGSRLGTTFHKATITDTFYADAPGFVQGSLRQTEFRLSQGFVASVTKVSRTTDLAAFGTLDELDYTSSVLLNLEKGVIRDIATPYSRNFVKVTYIAGFDPDGTDAMSYNLAQVPDWLQEAAKLKAKVQLAGSPSLEEASIKIDVKTLGSQVDTILHEKVRYAPVALLPL